MPNSPRVFLIEKQKVERSPGSEQVRSPSRENAGLGSGTGAPQPSCHAFEPLFATRTPPSPVMRSYCSATQPSAERTKISSPVTLPKSHAPHMLFAARSFTTVLRNRSRSRMRFVYSEYIVPEVRMAASTPACRSSASIWGRRATLEQSAVGAFSWQAAGWLGVGVGAGVGTGVAVGAGPGSLGVLEPPPQAGSPRTAATRRAKRGRSAIMVPFCHGSGERARGV